MTPNPPKLGSRLKEQRIGRGLSLEQVSASTKISLALLEGLERDDLSRWPTGIYRRSFFRAYLRAVGVGPEPFASELARLFPDEIPSRALESVPTPPVPREPLALVLADASTPVRSVSRRILLAVVEAAAVIGIGSLIALAGAMPLLTGSGIVALLYYPVMRAGAGRLGALSWRSIARIGSKPSSLSQQSREGSPAPAVNHGMARKIRRAATIAYLRLRRLPGDLASVYRPVATWVIRPIVKAVSRTGAAAGRAARSGAQATIRAASRISAWITFLFGVLGRAVARSCSFVARHTRRVGVRVLRASNYVLWKGVRAAANRAERLAVRQLGEAGRNSSGVGDDCSSGQPSPGNT